jgi:(1->4)-alpha-D-glucan 1-alpha-D-glucosylmutase
VVAFDRGGDRAGTGSGAGAVTVATRLPAGLAAAGGWRDTALQLPTGAWRDLIGGHRVVSDAAGVRLDELLSRLPVALLVRD